MALHAGKKSARSTMSSSFQSSIASSSDTEGKTLKYSTLTTDYDVKCVLNFRSPNKIDCRSRLQLIDSNADLLPSQLLRKYIAYAREYVHPVLDEEAKMEINHFYMHLRASQYTNDSTPITPRQLESLVRLSQVRVA